MFGRNSLLEIFLSCFADSNSDTENKTISLEQKLFSGFKGINTFQKTELETQKASLKLKQAKQQTILDTAYAYYDFIFKSKNEKFNLSNVNLFEIQVESDNARLQKGEITLRFGSIRVIISRCKCKFD